MSETSFLYASSLLPLAQRFGPSAYGTFRPKADVDASQPRVVRLALHGEDAKDASMDLGQGLVLHEALECLKP